MRTGRPPLDREIVLGHDIKVRVTEGVHERLLAYCRKTGQAKATVIRTALISFLDAEKEENEKNEK